MICAHSHIIEADSGDRDCQGVIKGTKSFGPNQLHKDTNVLRQCAAVQLLLQQQLPINYFTPIIHMLYRNRSVLCVSNLLQAVGCQALNLREKCVCLCESLGLHLLHQLQICFHSVFRRHAEHKLVLNHCGL